MKRKLLMIILSIILISCIRNKKNTLSIFNWAEYIDESIISQFEKENNIKINYEIFSNNEEMMIKFNNTKNYYDIIVPSEYLIGELIKNNKVEKLDYSKLKNVNKNIMKEFTNLKYDPGNVYSVPFYWGLMGILYNKKKVDIKDMKGFDILFNEKYKKEITMLDSPKDNIGVALKQLGYSINDHNIDHVKQAGELLKKQAPILLGYFSDIAAKSLMLNKEATIQLTWGGEAMDAMLQDKDLEFYAPENTNLWIDTLVIPIDAPNKEFAYKFINFLYENEISYKNFNETKYNSPNKNVIDRILKEAKTNPKMKLYIEERFMPRNFSKFEIFTEIPKEVKEEQIKIYTNLAP